MLNGLRLYGRYIGISFRSQMQYRASFIMLSVGHGLMTGLEFLGIWVLFDRFAALDTWSLPEVAFFYGLINIAFALCDAFSRGFDLFAATVKSGDFDRLLLRPPQHGLATGRTRTHPQARRPPHPRLGRPAVGRIRLRTGLGRRTSWSSSCSPSSAALACFTASSSYRRHYLFGPPRAWKSSIP